jgi:beta-lactamase superfamily II metal-dependent hydrolase
MSKGKLAGITAICVIAIIVIAVKVAPASMYTLSVSVDPSQAGSVSPSGGEYVSGSQVILAASPANGFTFDYWDGAASGYLNTVSVTIDSDKTVTAHFKVADSEMPPELGTLLVHFIDVGEGDSILLDIGDTEVLIDGGGKSPGVVSYINNYVDGSLEVMVATHPHADHIGGLIAVLGAFEVDEVWINGDTSTSQTYSQFMSAVNTEGCEVYEARRGNTIQVGNLTFDVLHPANLSGSTNDNSIVLSLSYGQVDFLFTGDVEQAAEASMLVQSIVPVPDVEILKVGHHGSSTASSIRFLQVTEPECAIYMAGEGNSYGHPHEEAINNLCEIGAQIYGTDIHGTVIITTNGVKYNVLPSNNVPPMVCSSTTTEEETGSGSNVQITYIFYDGAFYQTESDEYVEITNLGTTSQDLEGWVLIDISEGYPSFTFPSYVLAPGAKIRVYTNEIHSEWGGFSFGYGKAVWNNSSPDMAVLRNAQGQEVSRQSY